MLKKHFIIAAFICAAYFYCNQIWAIENMSQNNPLLFNNELADFTTIKAEHFEPAVDKVLQDYIKVIEAVSDVQEITWNTSIQLLEEAEEKFARVWNVIEHLQAVASVEDIRLAYEKVLPKVTNFSSFLMQNEQIYNIYNKIKASEEFATLNVAQKTTIEHALRDFKLSGVNLDENKKQQYKEIRQRLSDLSNKFGNNSLDGTLRWNYKVMPEDKDKLAGLPQHIIMLAADKAQQNKLSGWLLTLDMPVYIAVMQYAKHRELREEFYKAYSTRASSQGPFAGQDDNTQVIEEILKLRQSLAELVGYANYAEYSLASKMAPSTNAVMDFLLDLNSRSHDAATKEFAMLEQFAKNKDHLDSMQAWDVSYYAEIYRQQKFNVSEEELRQYFVEDNVLAGMFRLVNKLYGISIKEIHDFPKWHTTVRLFEVFDKNKHSRGKFYVDLYARDFKRSGAWAAEARSRMRFADGSLQLPVGILEANFTPPVADKPALLTHDEIITLFHEFGHTLHNVLTQVDLVSVAGTNGVAWDAVELPSQFMENWCWEWEVIEDLSGHYQTGEKLSKHKFENLLATKNFLSAMGMVRQLEFALFDFRIHLNSKLDQNMSVQAILDNVRQQVAVIPYPKYNRFQNNFLHIFDGGYAAGYYSYKWAEVLSSDVFEAFKEQDILVNPTIGDKFLHTILEQGGSKDAMELFIAFRGRKPTIDALLKHSGIGT